MTWTGYAATPAHSRHSRSRLSPGRCCTKLTRSLDGKPVAGDSYRRRRKGLNAALEYAAESHDLDGNPLKLVKTKRDGIIGSTTYSRVWEEARQIAFTPRPGRIPARWPPYDLRHAALTTWLNAVSGRQRGGQQIAGDYFRVLTSHYDLERRTTKAPQTCGLLRGNST
jgi:hypothetical protein